MKPERLPDRPLPESYWVIPGRFLAGGHPASTGGDREMTRQRLAAFLDQGFDTFFDLTRPGEQPDYQPELLEQAGGRQRTVDYRRFPVGDFGLPTPAQMSALLEALEDALAAGRKVYLHCWGGIGRTGTAVGCWLVRGGHSGPTALERLAELYQAAAQSRLYPHSPETEAQRAFIRDWGGG